MLGQPSDQYHHLMMPAGEGAELAAAVEPAGGRSPRGPPRENCDGAVVAGRHLERLVALRQRLRPLRGGCGRSASLVVMS